MQDVTGRLRVALVGASSSSCTGNTRTLERSAMGVLINADTPPCITLVATVLEATIMAIAER